MAANAGEPFFIIGTQRSGTTLLGRILNAHPRLYCLNELSEGEGLAPLWHAYEHLEETPQAAGSFTRLLAERLHLSAPYASPARTNRWTVLEHIEAALERRARACGKKRWGIKDPRLTYFADAFRRRAPGGRFIIVVRDARGVCNSYVHQRENVANVYYGARLWQAEVERQLTFLRAHPGSTHSLRYEDLLDDPERELRRICAFLAEDYTPDLLRYHEYPPDFRVHEPNVNVTGPVDPSVGARWRSELRDRQIGVIETIAGDTMRVCGYTPSGIRAYVGWPLRAAYALHQWVLTNYWWQRRSGWYGLRKRLRVLHGQVAHRRPRRGCAGTDR